MVKHVKREHLVRDHQLEPLANAYARRDLRTALLRALIKLDPIDVQDLCNELIPVEGGQTPLYTLEKI